ncbi:hypothetical protein [Telmatospirillum sp.]|uniref:hypothetical protein n=1 Tax=Telmatospirillum sp. TaxID=2079197 RepID=UPI002846DFCE|nr:hypothetical protein [Telmatospirillum sp.]MDR3437354.1 hypothetical protein [Telmatospirillum sp.]
MPDQEFGPLRSRASRKPWPECPDIAIHRCHHCGRLCQELGYEEPAKQPVCCGIPMERLEPRHLADLPSGIVVGYKIVGGFNQNAVQVFWEIEQPGDKPEWVLLKTFTGSYIKYLTENKCPPLVFPMSDEDAYVYCDRDVCKQCIFRCKRGFIIFFYIKHYGLF